MLEENTNPEEIKQSYFKIRSSSVEHLKELIHDLKGNKSDELNEKIKELEQELENLKNTKKYGLVWDSEKEPEQVVLDCQKKLPILKEEKTRKILNDDSGDSNLLIEGDNYHALQVLNYTHKEAIDVIYIDPPYNTGGDDFTYNDKIVDKEDTYRHSKWLNFMEKRLRLAHNLLKEDGVIFISIDDNEQAQLKLLCNEIFGEENFVAKLSIENNPKGRKNSNFISVSNEYCLIYSKDINKSYFIENIPKDVNALALDENGVYIHNSGKRVLVGENKFNDFVTDFYSDKHYTIYFNMMGYKPLPSGRKEARKAVRSGSWVLNPVCF